jgi:hypothetical protein
MGAMLPLLVRLPAALRLIPHPYGAVRNELIKPAKERLELG